MNVTRVVMDAMPHKDYDVHTVYLTIKILEDGGYITYDTPVDTISIKREVLQGVIAAIKDMNIAHNMTQTAMTDHAYWNDEVDRLKSKALASLDAVLAEGQS